jgi:hypothetical protein
VSVRVIKLYLRRHVHGHHQRAINAMYKATEEINLEIFNLLYIRTTSNLTMWVRSYRTENLARLCGVRSSVMDAAPW